MRYWHYVYRHNTIAVSKVKCGLWLIIEKRLELVFKLRIVIDPHLEL
jgi:hypothetical protein